MATAVLSLPKAAVFGALGRASTGNELLEVLNVVVEPVADVSDEPTVEDQADYEGFDSYVQENDYNDEV
jgi:hypothetical protein